MCASKQATTWCSACVQLHVQPSTVCASKQATSVVQCLCTTACATKHCVCVKAGHQCGAVLVYNCMCNQALCVRQSRPPVWCSACVQLHVQPSTVCASKQATSVVQCLCTTACATKHCVCVKAGHHLVQCLCTTACATKHCVCVKAGHQCGAVLVYNCMCNQALCVRQSRPPVWCSACVQLHVQPSTVCASKQATSVVQCLCTTACATKHCVCVKAGHQCGAVLVYNCMCNQALCVRQSRPPVWCSACLQLHVQPSTVCASKQATSVVQCLCTTACATKHCVCVKAGHQCGAVLVYNCMCNQALCVRQSRPPVWCSACVQLHVQPSTVCASKQATSVVQCLCTTACVTKHCVCVKAGHHLVQCLCTTACATKHCVCVKAGHQCGAVLVYNCMCNQALCVRQSRPPVWCSACVQLHVQPSTVCASKQATSVVQCLCTTACATKHCVCVKAGHQCGAVLVYNCMCNQALCVHQSRPPPGAVLVYNCMCNQALCVRQSRPPVWCSACVQLHVQPSTVCASKQATSVVQCLCTTACATKHCVCVKAGHQCGAVLVYNCMCNQALCVRQSRPPVWCSACVQLHVQPSTVCASKQATTWCSACVQLHVQPSTVCASKQATSVVQCLCTTACATKHCVCVKAGHQCGAVLVYNCMCNQALCVRQSRPPVWCSACVQLHVQPSTVCASKQATSVVQCLCTTACATKHCVCVKAGHQCGAVLVYNCMCNQALCVRQSRPPVWCSACVQLHVQPSTVCASKQATSVVQCLCTTACATKHCVCVKAGHQCDAVLVYNCMCNQALCVRQSRPPVWCSACVQLHVQPSTVCASKQASSVVQCLCTTACATKHCVCVKAGLQCGAVPVYNCMCNQALCVRQSRPPVWCSACVQLHVQPSTVCASKQASSVVQCLCTTACATKHCVCVKAGHQCGAVLVYNCMCNQALCVRQSRPPVWCSACVQLHVQPSTVCASKQASSVVQCLCTTACATKHCVCVKAGHQCGAVLVYNCMCNQALCVRQSRPPVWCSACVQLHVQPSTVCASKQASSVVQCLCTTACATKHCVCVKAGLQCGAVLVYNCMCNQALCVRQSRPPVWCSACVQLHVQPSTVCASKQASSVVQCLCTTACATKHCVCVKAGLQCGAVLVYNCMCNQALCVRQSRPPVWCSACVQLHVQPSTVCASKQASSVVQCLCTTACATKHCVCVKAGLQCGAVLVYNCMCNQALCVRQSRPPVWCSACVQLHVQPSTVCASKQASSVVQCLCTTACATKHCVCVKAGLQCGAVLVYNCMCNQALCVRQSRPPVWCSACVQLHVQPSTVCASKQASSVVQCLCTTACVTKHCVCVKAGHQCGAVLVYNCMCNQALCVRQGRPPVWCSACVQLHVQPSTVCASKQATSVVQCLCTTACVTKHCVCVKAGHQCGAVLVYNCMCNQALCVRQSRPPVWCSACVQLHVQPSTVCASKQASSVVQCLCTTACATKHCVCVKAGLQCGAVLVYNCMCNQALCVRQSRPPVWCSACVQLHVQPSTVCASKQASSVVQCLCTTACATKHCVCVKAGLQCGAVLVYNCMCNQALCVRQSRPPVWCSACVQLHV